MIDVGLIISVLVAGAAAEALALFRAPSTTSDGPVGAGLWAVIAGVIVGRLTSMALDDPGSLIGGGDLATSRGGVEFWPGLAAAIAVVALGARRHHTPVAARIADLAPYGLLAVAGYQATCVVREGCFGPESAFGLTPPGISRPLFPVELAGAVALAGFAVVLVRTARWGHPWVTAALALWALAFQRSVISFWLPVVGPGLSRAHRESIGVAVVGSVVLLGWAGHSLVHHRPPSPVIGT